MALGWILTLLGYALNEVHFSPNGAVDDFGVLIFWSAFFVMLAWIFFVNMPFQKLNHSSRIFSPFILPVLSGVYAVAVFFLLIGWLFLHRETIIFWFLTLSIGIIAGIAYSNLIRQSWMIAKVETKLWMRVLIFLLPFKIALIFLVVFPFVFPSTAFRYMPDTIQDKIVAHTIPRFSPGNDFEKLRNALPGYFDTMVPHNSGGMAAHISGFSFNLKVEKGKITELNYERK